MCEALGNQAQQVNQYIDEYGIPTSYQHACLVPQMYQMRLAVAWCC